MKSLKHSVKSGLLLSLVGALVMGCGRQESSGGKQVGEAATPPKAGRVFGVSFQTLNNPFFVDLNEGLKEVIEARGDRLVTLDAQFNSHKQRNDCSDLLLQEVAGVFLNPVNWEGIMGTLVQAKQKNVPVVVGARVVRHRPGGRRPCSDRGASGDNSLPPGCPACRYSAGSRGSAGTGAGDDSDRCV
jgi:ribose transport system substrate-binding protein